MPIKVLPAQLANQIAAGEVVERPASVVKELVENCLDAGASKIEIEIEKGGHKRILVRDNGRGISKSELSLALSRHATSKISSLDDLEAIVSLGFRGEALASISSVSRLTLTAKPAEQTQAWLARTEGRDMQVQTMPVAHPKGTSVEVLDLFFNTPARRKFLRAEKTEFAHIDEVIKRIALSHFEVTFVLKHNGKIVKNLPAITQEANYFQRVSKLVGSDFAARALAIQSDSQDMHLHGWIADASCQRKQNDLQYFYLNGRVIRDKLVNHAIRQALENILAADSYPAYVLYLTVPAQHVDVNVHPSKHEVRFHQSRLVHDFIVRAVTDVFDATQLLQSAGGAAPVTHDYIRPLESVSGSNELLDYVPSVKEASAPYPRQSAPWSSASTSGDTRPSSISRSAAANYQSLMWGAVDNASAANSAGKPFLLLPEQRLLLQVNEQFYLLKLSRLWLHQLQQLWTQQAPVAQPLLMPVAIQADKSMIARAQQLHQSLLELGLELGWNDKRVMVRKVPADCRNLPWTELLPKILAWPEQQQSVSIADLVDSLAQVAFKLNQRQLEAALNWLVAQEQETILAVLRVTQSDPLPLLEWLSKYDL